MGFNIDTSSIIKNNNIETFNENNKSAPNKQDFENIWSLPTLDNANNIKSKYKKDDKSVIASSEDLLKYVHSSINLSTLLSAMKNHGSEEDQYIIEIFENNPHFVFQEIGLMIDECDIDGDGMTDYSIEYYYYEIYDPIKDRTYYIQTNMQTEVNPLDIVETFNNLPATLSEYNKEVRITSEDSPYDAYWQDFYGIDDFHSTAIAWDDTIAFYGCGLTDLECAKATVYHETAHNKDQDSDFDEFYTISNSEVWRKAVESDNNIQGINTHISSDGTRLSSQYAAEAYESYYGSTGQYCEDYAEAITNLYIMGPELYQQEYPARAEVLKIQFPEMFD